jgi:hypothetical protein
VLTTDGTQHELTPGFEVTVNFLDTWLGDRVEAFIVNDIVIRLRVYGDFDEVEKEYPEPGREDIPF